MAMSTTHTITIKKTGRGGYSLRLYTDRDSYSGKTVSTIDDVLDTVEDWLAPPTQQVMMGEPQHVG
jgi:hypothetical protein